MANTTFIVQDKATTPSAAHPPEARHFRLIDGLLLIGFMAAFVGLVLLLAK